MDVAKKGCMSSADEVSDGCGMRVQLFKENPDSRNPEYATKLGIYEENCGLDKVVMSWGHDEYMYQVRCDRATFCMFCTQPTLPPCASLSIAYQLHAQVMKRNNTTLPPAALFVIRYHSFYGEVLQPP
jgi:inositol oxygenase